MRRISKSCSMDETGWDQALALPRAAQVLLGLLDPMLLRLRDCSEGRCQVRDSDVSDDFKLRYLVRTLVRSVILQMHECNRTAKDSGCLPSGSPNSLPTLPAQEGMGYFLRDILK